MGDTIQANYDELSNINHEISTISTDLRKEYDKLDKKWSELYLHWQGEAFEKHNAESTQFNNGFVGLIEALDGGRERIEKIIQILRTAEEEAGQRQKAKAS